MQTPLTIATQSAPAGKAIGPNRFAPRDEALSPEQRFARLLQQRREAEPQKPQPPAAGPEPGPQANPAAPSAPITRAPEGGDTDAAAPGTDTPATDTPPVASTGCEAAEPRPTGKPATRPSADWRDLPIIEVPMLPPTAAIDGSAPASAAAADDRADGTTVATDRGDAPPAMPATGLPLWPGMPSATTDAASRAAHGAAPANVGATPEWRSGVTPGAAGTNVAAGLPLAHGAAGGAAGGTAGDAAQYGADRRGGNDRGADTAARQGVALADAAASNADVIAAANAAADRFALPPRAPTHDAAVPILATHAAPQRIDAGPAPTVALPTPLTAPDFAKALGAQVSLFARDGLAQAELRLTPAEMGPIRVHIAIDGAQARVDFAADSAATRQVIERAMPELASALREQGLTLAGGGVFQRAPDERGAGTTPESRVTRAAPRRGKEAVDAIDSAAPAARAHALAARRGGIDLYA